MGFWTKDGKLLVQSGKAIHCDDPPACCTCQSCTDQLPNRWLLFFYYAVGWECFDGPDQVPCDPPIQCDGDCSRYTEEFWEVSNREYIEVPVGEGPDFYRCFWRWTGPGACEDHGIIVVMTMDKIPGTNTANLYAQVCKTNGDPDPDNWLPMGNFSNTFAVPMTCLFEFKSLNNDTDFNVQWDCMFAENLLNKPNCELIGAT